MFAKNKPNKQKITEILNELKITWVIEKINVYNYKIQ